MIAPVTIGQVADVRLGPALKRGEASESRQFRQSLFQYKSRLEQIRLRSPNEVDQLLTSAGKQPSTRNGS